MGKHTNNRSHPAGADRATVDAIASQMLAAPTQPMTVAADPPVPPPPDEWVSPDEWLRNHSGHGQVNR